jgi:[acyl-carrier-protein] S-malonyltransferase
MEKTALLFAGQGAQVVGMGKDLAECFPTARALFSQANEILGYDLASLCFQGPEAELVKTENAQPGIYLVSWVAFRLLEELRPGLIFHATAGLSLGEFTALAAAGALSFEDGLRLVHQRGRFMQEACDATHGSMAAILGLDEASTRAVCEENGVALANLNCPGQIVISGQSDRIGKACAAAQERGAKRAMALKVAGAYHSPLMVSAQPKLEAMLSGILLNAPRVPVLSNVTAQTHGSPEETRRRLVEQVTSCVRWEDSIRHLVAQGFTRYVELGPGSALSGFMKRIERGAKILNINDATSLETTVKALSAHSI